MFGVEQCSVEDWTSCAIFIVICIYLTIRSVKRMQYEQMLKIKHGEGLASSDIDLRGSNLIKLVVISFLGGWVSGALGLGGGSIFNPLLLSFGVPPPVSSATGMYMIIFSTGASTTTYVLNDMLNVPYGMFAAFWCIFGTVCGMIALDKFMKKIGRSSPLVFLLAFVLGISAVAVPYFGWQ